MSTVVQTAPAGSWLKVATAKENVFVSCRTIFDVGVYVSATAPDGSSPFHVCSLSRPFSMAGISGVDVWIKSLANDPVPVVVTAV